MVMTEHSLGPVRPVKGASLEFLQINIECSCHELFRGAESILAFRRIQAWKSLQGWAGLPLAIVEFSSVRF